MSTPDVTVTVIVYNDAERLTRAVDSVRRQTHANVEIVISDDHSTDGTPEVARRLADQDPRVRHLRLERNSGGCSVPRNRALDIARAPYLMFLDSDDELPDDAVALLLAAHREREIDFAMGAVQRVRVDNGRRSTWMPHLVAERRTLDGIAADPRLLFEHLSTSKMYARAFLDRHGLRFPEGIHYEDQLFSARAYCLAKRFTIVPEPVYRWYVAPYATSEAASISNQRHKLANVRDRIHVQHLIDAFLAESGHESLREDKDYKFLKHDFRMYAGDLPYRDEAWLSSFADLVTPYLDTLAPGAFARLPRAERVVLQLIRDRRLPEAGWRHGAWATAWGRGRSRRTGRAARTGATGSRPPHGPAANWTSQTWIWRPAPSRARSSATRSRRSPEARAPPSTSRSAPTTRPCASPSAPGAPRSSSPPADTASMSTSASPPSAPASSRATPTSTSEQPCSPSTASPESATPCSACSTRASPTQASSWPPWPSRPSPPRSPTTT